MTRRRYKGISRALKMMHILIRVVVTRVHAYVKFHLAVYVSFMYFMVYVIFQEKVKKVFS